MHLGFEVLRGNSATDKGHRQVEVKRSDDGIVLQNLNTFYLANITLSSNNQSIGVLLDTGSSDLWVPLGSCEGLSEDERRKRKKREEPKKQEDLEWREKKDENGEDSHDSGMAYYDEFNCLSFGYFSPNSLTTFHRNFSALDLDFVQFGEYRVNMTFGMASYSDIQPVMGIGLVENEILTVDTSYYLDNENVFSYLDFPLRLKGEGFVKSNSYSVLLGRNNASLGEILFGAVDHGRYDGNLQRVKIVNKYQGAGYKPFSLDIILDAISGDNLVIQDQTSVLLDSGATLLKLPESYMEELVEYFHLEYGPDGLYEIDCSYLLLDKPLTFHFSGIEIQVPIRDLVFQFHACYFGIRDSSATHILGDNFLRNAYVVYNMDNTEIAMAQAVATPGPEDIEEIGTLIPLALEAPYYNRTELEEFYVTDSDHYVDEETQTVNLPLYLFVTKDRSEIDLGNTT